MAMNPNMALPMLAMASSLILGIRPTFSDDARCALSVEKYQLCFSRSALSKECRSLDPKMHTSEQFRCLVRSIEPIKHCFGVTIAQNVFVRLDPFGVRYELVLF